MLYEYGCYAFVFVSSEAVIVWFKQIDVFDELKRAQFFITWIISSTMWTVGLRILAFNWNWNVFTLVLATWASRCCDCWTENHWITSRKRTDWWIKFTWSGTSWRLIGVRVRAAEWIASRATTTWLFRCVSWRRLSFIIAYFLGMNSVNLLMLIEINCQTMDDMQEWEIKSYTEYGVKACCVPKRF